MRTSRFHGIGFERRRADELEREPELESLDARDLLTPDLNAVLDDYPSELVGKIIESGRDAELEDLVTFLHLLSADKQLRSRDAHVPLLAPDKELATVFWRYGNNHWNDSALVGDFLQQLKIIQAMPVRQLMNGGNFQNSWRTACNEMEDSQRGEATRLRSLRALTLLSPIVGKEVPEHKPLTLDGDLKWHIENPLDSLLELESGRLILPLGPEIYKDAVTLLSNGIESIRLNTELTQITKAKIIRVIQLIDTLSAEEYKLTENGLYIRRSAEDPLSNPLPARSAI